MSRNSIDSPLKWSIESVNQKSEIGNQYLSNLGITNSPEQTSVSWLPQTCNWLMRNTVLNSCPNRELIEQEWTHVTEGYSKTTQVGRFEYASVYLSIVSCAPAVIPLIANLYKRPVAVALARTRNQHVILDGIPIMLVIFWNFTVNKLWRMMTNV